MRRFLKVVPVAAMVFAAAWGVPVRGEAAERHTLLISAGEAAGYYFPTAGAICRVLNKEKPQGAGCAVVPSSGSAANLSALRTGDVDLALVQSRAGALAFAGQEPFSAQGPFSDLRALMSLHGEVVAVAVRQGAGIESLADLKGKRVNLGRSGSFQRSMAELVLEAAGIGAADISPMELDLGEQGGELCEGNIDAAIFSGIHPMPELANVIDECNAVLLPLKGKSVDALLKRDGWLSVGKISRGTYEDMREDVPSLQLKAVLAATSRMSPEEAKAIVTALHANWGAFTRLYPVLNSLGRAEAAKDGIAFKIHEGIDNLPTEGSTGK